MTCPSPRADAPGGGRRGRTGRAARRRPGFGRGRRAGVGLAASAAALAALAVAAPRARQAEPSPAANQPAGHQRMLAALRQVADRAPDAHPYIGEGPVRRLRAALETLPASASASDRWRLTMRLAEEELRLGDEAAAIRLFRQARALVSRREQDDPRRVHTLYRLGVAYLRLGETQNCARHPTANSCILPLRADGLHRRRDPSRQAADAFLQVLESTPEPKPEHLTAGVRARNLAVRAAPQAAQAEAASIHLAARWLLNLAHMTLGSYPDQVPEAHRIPPGTFESAEPTPRFENVAPALGLDTFDLCGGAVADDFDNDGYLDVMVSTWDTEGQLRLFRNDRDGTFTERTDEAGLTGLYGGLNLVQADYDNDGAVDVFVLRGAWLHERGRHPNSLLRNNGDGTFTDVTFDAGLGDVHYPTQTASWADYDNDGDLDLYVGNETSPALTAPNQLFRNDGDGTFTDVAASAGVMNHAYAKAVIWGDYDGDRLPDLYVSNSGGRNRLYRNAGDGRFVDEARRLGVTRPIESFPAWFWDVDNDGALDLYVAAYNAGVEHLAAGALGFPLDVELARLYRGVGGGRFEEASERFGLAQPNAPMGANFGDLDNDGYPDFYLGTGYPPYHSLMPSVLYRNRGGRRFSDVTYAAGMGHLQKGHGVLFADLDHDGDQDVFAQMGGAFPGDRFGNALYENPGFGNHWITVKLVGVRSNRSAIGARIRAEVVEDGARRSIHRHVNSGGAFGANPLRQTIGLGKAQRIDRLEIFWPTTGLTQTFSDLPVDRIIRIVEGEASYSTLDLKTLAFRKD